jgi:crotonobetainyl-CoA:carnitine CoA-transferase CaiB-like acyl-CoA transferase
MSLRPLAGIRASGLNIVLVGPFCTMALAALGADVGKVERPGGGDDARSYGPFLPSGESAYFVSVNRGKRSVVLDLEDAFDRGALPGLVDRADVLVERGPDGPGCDIDLAMLDCSTSVLENAVARYAVTGVTPEPLGARHPALAPFQAFRASDELFVIAAGNDRLWVTLHDVVGCPENARDSRFASNRARSENHDDLEQVVNERLAMRPARESLVALRAAGVPRSW